MIRLFLSSVLMGMCLLLGASWSLAQTTQAVDLPSSSLAGRLSGSKVGQAPPYRIITISSVPRLG